MPQLVGKAHIWQKLVNGETQKEGCAGKRNTEHTVSPQFGSHFAPECRHGSFTKGACTTPTSRDSPGRPPLLKVNAERQFKGGLSPWKMPVVWSEGCVCGQGDKGWDIFSSSAVPGLKASSAWTADEEGGQGGRRSWDNHLRIPVIKEESSLKFLFLYHNQIQILINIHAHF